MPHSDNPFEEDADRTVMRPAPGGRRAAPPPSAAAPEPDRPRAAPAAPVAHMDGAEGAPDIGVNPIVQAAAPLLALLSRLRNTASQPDPADLRERAVREVRQFEQACRAAEVPMEQLRPAHYAICASLDDVVLATPWGSQGAWAGRSLISTFHNEVRSGERFFDLLNKLKQNPGSYLPVLELMYLCLSLGMIGKYRLSQRGPTELDAVREDLYQIIVRQKAKPAEPELSPRWRGLARPYKPARAGVPSWVGVVAALLGVGGIWFWASSGLADGSDAAFQRLITAPPDPQPQIARVAPVTPPPPPPPPAPEAQPEPSALDRLREFLRPEIDQGLVSVVGSERRPVVRIKGTGMFRSGSADVSTDFTRLLERIGAALVEEPGKVTVQGHSDNVPIRTVRFPSNFQLSAARAEAAMKIILNTLKDPARIGFEGKADAEPIASNATPDGREANRRIEVVLQRP